MDFWEVNECSVKYLDIPKSLANEGHRRRGCSGEVIGENTWMIIIWKQAMH